MQKYKVHERVIQGNSHMTQHVQNMDVQLIQEEQFDRKY